MIMRTECTDTIVLAYMKDKQAHIRCDAIHICLCFLTAHVFGIEKCCVFTMVYPFMLLDVSAPPISGTEFTIVHSFYMACLRPV